MFAGLVLWTDCGRVGRGEVFDLEAKGVGGIGIRFRMISGAHSRRPLGKIIVVRPGNACAIIGPEICDIDYGTCDNDAGNEQKHLTHSDSLAYSLLLARLDIASVRNDSTGIAFLSEFLANHRPPFP